MKYHNTITYYDILTPIVRASQYQELQLAEQSELAAAESVASEAAKHDPWLLSKLVHFKVCILESVLWSIPLLRRNAQIISLFALQVCSRNWVDFILVELFGFSMGLRFEWRAPAVTACSGATWDVSEPGSFLGTS